MNTKEDVPAAVQKSDNELMPFPSSFNWDPLSSLGFIMKGPSSSHTAGPNLLARQVYRLLGTQPIQISITLYNSLGDVWFGHGTVGAIIAGLLGYGPSSNVITEANKNPKAFALSHNLDIQWAAQHDATKHPNAIQIFASSPTKAVSLTGDSLGGGRIRYTTI